MKIALIVLKVKVRGQSQTLKVKVKVRNAVGGSSIVKRGQFSSLFCDCAIFVAMLYMQKECQSVRNNALLLTFLVENDVKTDLFV